MLKACVNGARGAEEHPALPVTVQALAREAAAVAAAGADAVHLHVKDARGMDTLDAGALADVLTAVRRSAPGLPVGVSTGAWAEPDPAVRLAAIRSWGRVEQRPDFASVNWHEDRAEDVAAALLELGVGVEAGLWHPAAARAWLASPARERCTRVLVELPEDLDPAAVASRADHLVHLVRQAPLVRRGEQAVVLHGAGASAWPALRHALDRGLSTRIGLEDVLVLPDGGPAADNAALVRAARQLQAAVRRGSRLRRR